MMLCNPRPARRIGTAAVELAVCLPLLLVVISGIWEVGRMVSAQQIIANAAREGGREIAAGQSSTATVQQYVVNYCNMNGLTGVTTSMVTVANVTNSSRSDPTTCNQLDQWRVTVTVPYNTMKWSSIAQITPTSNLTSSSDWYSMRDSSLTINSSIPTN
ncbi:MAG: pilus assembly protein [Planctomycetes bacterium]|nr:pilus assembly protein [Planctomycetota bacterium]